MKKIQFISTMNKQLLTLIITIPLMASCSSNYTFNSNVKPNVAKEYFSTSQVKIYTDESEFTTNYLFVGLVEGDDCQTKPHLASPDDIIARTKARQSAYVKQANAVIFTGCVDIDTKHCVAQVVCYAKAYRVGEIDTETKQ